jgi:CheY-like chemotaxis protein
MVCKVLIVEDEVIVAEDIRSKLVDRGFKVIGIADSFDKALEIVKEQRPDLMILDIRIKGEINGVETAIILATHYDQPVPIVFLTAFSESEFPVLKAVESYAYVNKPFTDEALFEAVQNALNTSRASLGS